MPSITLSAIRSPVPSAACRRPCRRHWAPFWAVSSRRPCPHRPATGVVIKGGWWRRAARGRRRPCRPLRRRVLSRLVMDARPPEIAGRPADGRTRRGRTSALLTPPPAAVNQTGQRLALGRRGGLADATLLAAGGGSGRHVLQSALVGGRASSATGDRRRRRALFWLRPPRHRRPLTSGTAVALTDDKWAAGWCERRHTLAAAADTLTACLSA